MGVKLTDNDGERKPKLYGMSEYLMIMQAAQKARLADRARKAGSEPGEVYGAIRHDERVPKVEARKEVVSKGATQ